MKKTILLMVTFVVQVSFAQNPSRVGTLEITNDGVYNSSINSGNVARMDMGFDGAKGFIKFGAHTGNGQRDNILYMRGSDGNVGIGTNDPSQKLDVNGNAIVRGALVSTAFSDTGGHIQLLNPSKNSNGGASAWMIYNMTGGYGNSLQFWAYDNLNCGVPGGMCTNRFTITDTGNVGIGEAKPESKLILKDNNQVLSFLTNQKLNGTWPPVAEMTTMTIQSSGLSSGNIAFATGNTEMMRIQANGNVGIGLVNPTNKLDVNGTIHSKEVKVDLSGWPDYVFKKEYTLPTLEEVEKHITEKGHLKNIPSEEEVLKNGINLGEMNIKLLQKIEEMTLYMIEQNKKINDLQRENKKLDDLEKKFEKFEKTLKHKTK
ncbi:hypothetical protein [Flavobacterium sp. T12S277]|uniref:hypothetical protein n=1 Tax=Flavobacterium sp. T12S277 TaxID=3402752 RepID=UPI003AE4E0CD